MHFVYIIYSERINQFYVGESADFEKRLDFHNDPNKNDNTTKKGMPWREFWKHDVGNVTLARKIERHIKNMKSRKYFFHLRDYPELIEKLKQKYM